MQQILLVDDDNAIRGVLAKILTKNGFKVLSAENGMEALKLYKQHQPQIIVTDILMPEQDGVELILEARAINPKVKIVAISGGGRIEANDLLRIANGLGANNILMKPFDPEQLLQILKQLA